MSAIVLLISGDRDLRKRLTRDSIDFGDVVLTTVCVESHSDAIRCLRTNQSIDAILMDWDLPDISGIDALELLIDAAPHVPIIVLGNEGEFAQQMNIVEQGAEDYLLKNRVEPGTVTGMVYSAIARKYRADILSSGKERWLVDRLEHGIIMAQRYGRRLAVLHVELDRSKLIDDFFSFAIADPLLGTVALRIMASIRSSDTVTVSGSDQIIVILSEISRGQDATVVAEKIRLAISAHTNVHRDQHLTATIGVALYPEDSAEPEALIRCARAALLSAKAEGRSQSQRFSEEMVLAGQVGKVVHRIH